MYSQLKEKLWAYIVQNNPDLMFRLQDDYRVTAYLEEKVSAVMPTALSLLEQNKPGHAIHELCLNAMTTELKPSRYNYMISLLASEFKTENALLRASGSLGYEAVNLVEHCAGTFDELGLCEQNVRDPGIYKTITEKVAAYLVQQKI
ncbi:hypothetical protein [Pedobacter panaciterrae]|uniref:hypothetical protein n=1 Tax=Pedobacter panaciterrae TaxID=363849 RepID=UPI0025977979|nr:hypothetical protein [uncultured Pedobacter sp.]